MYSELVWKKVFLLLQNIIIISSGEIDMGIFNAKYCIPLILHLVGGGNFILEEYYES